MAKKKSSKKQDEQAVLAHKKSMVDSNNVIAVALAIISLCALVVSIYQTKVFVAQQKITTMAEKAQLWPRIEPNFGGFYTELGAEKVYFKIKNVGTGPAIIDDFKIIYKDSVYSSWYSIYLDMLPDTVTPPVYVSITNSIPLQDVIQPGEVKTLFLLNPDYPDSARVALDEFTGADMPHYSICYSSVFKDHWTIEGRLDEEPLPKEVGQSCTSTEKE
jgi:hypothetical protein